VSAIEDHITVHRKAEKEEKDHMVDGKANSKYVSWSRDSLIQLTHEDVNGF